MKSKTEIYEELKSYCSVNEFDPIKDKIKRYLQIYTGWVEFETFSFTTQKGYIENITLYIDKDNNICRKLFFDQYGDLVSVQYYIGDEYTTGLSKKSIDYINGDIDRNQSGL